MDASLNLLRASFAGTPASNHHHHHTDASMSRGGGALGSSLGGGGGGGGGSGGGPEYAPVLHGQATELAKQLSMQLDYNNDLLAQITRLEESQLASQKAAADKQASLRQAMAAAEAARQEAADLRRKLAVAQVRVCACRG
jgi:hypothetical protein